MDDRALVQATLRGDTEAYGTLIRKYQRTLYATARYLVGDAEQAEDLLQDAVVKGYRKLAELKDQHRFRAWLFAILRHECLNYLQLQHPECQPLDNYAETLAAVIKGDE